MGCLEEAARKKALSNGVFRACLFGRADWRELPAQSDGLSERPGVGKEVYFLALGSGDRGLGLSWQGNGAGGGAKVRW